MHPSPFQGGGVTLAGEVERLEAEALVQQYHDAVKQSPSGKVQILMAPLECPRNMDNPSTLDAAQVRLAAGKRADQEPVKLYNDTKGSMLPPSPKQPAECCDNCKEPLHKPKVCAKVSTSADTYVDPLCDRKTNTACSSFLGQHGAILILPSAEGPVGQEGLARSLSNVCC